MLHTPTLSLSHPPTHIQTQTQINQILALGLDERNFAPLSEAERAQFPFKLENHVDVITRLLPLDPNLGKVGGLRIAVGIGLDGVGLGWVGVWVGYEPQPNPPPTSSHTNPPHQTKPKTPHTQPP